MSQHKTACPLDYRYEPSSLNRNPDLQAETIYVVGGLYGNPEAMHAVLQMKEKEERNGGRVTLIFNGDFNWFNLHPESYREVNRLVGEHHAIRGNVESELARLPAGPDDAQDCGCNYPPGTDPGVVSRSNQIFRKLNATAREFPELTIPLGQLPANMVVGIAGQRIAVLHGDPESLAGWSLSSEALMPLAAESSRQSAKTGLGHPRPSSSPASQNSCEPPPRTTTPLETVRDYFEQSGALAFATTHTCLPFLQNFRARGAKTSVEEDRLIINNGSAGMPNFQDTRHGLLTRISSREEIPPESLYGTTLQGVRFDALPIVYDAKAWISRFRKDWPQGSPAYESYYNRILNGPRYFLHQAQRLPAIPSSSDLRSA